MIARYFDRFPCWLAVALSGLLVSSAPAAENKELKIDARLVWGTNAEESPDTNHIAVGPELTKKLQKTFKWQHYFLVNRQQTNVGAGETKSIKMSEHCTVSLKNLGDRRVEVKLMGDGKLVGTCTNPLPEGEDLILGGDAKNGTAWFVVLRTRPQDGKTTAAPEKAVKDKESKPDKKDGPDSKAK